MKEYSDFKRFLSESLHADVVRTVREATPGLLFHLLDQFTLQRGIDIDDPASERFGMTDLMRDLRNVTPKDEYEMDSLQAENLVGRLSESQMIYILLDLLENPEKIKGDLKSMIRELDGFFIEGEPIVDYLKSM